MSDRLLDVTVYLQIEARDRFWSTEDHAYTGEPRSAAVIRSTAKPPKDPRAGTVVTKLVVRVPSALFMQPKAFAVVEIDQDSARLIPTQVVATMPEED